jgi:hypothetical protein
MPCQALNSGEQLELNEPIYHGNQTMVDRRGVRCSRRYLCALSGFRISGSRGWKGKAGRSVLPAGVCTIAPYDSH